MKRRWLEGEMVPKVRKCLFRGYGLSLKCLKNIGAEIASKNCEEQA